MSCSSSCVHLVAMMIRDFIVFCLKPPQSGDIRLRLLAESLPRVSFRF